MKAAEMLVEMLLTEAGYAIVYGPNIPATGYWVTGGDAEQMAANALKGLKVKVAKGMSPVNTLMAQGYTLVARIGTDLVAYGQHAPQLNAISRRMLGVDRKTPMVRYKQDATKAQPTTARAVFGDTVNVPKTAPPASNLTPEYTQAWQAYQQKQRFK